MDHLIPRKRILEGGKEGVAFHYALDPGQVKYGAVGQELTIDVRTSADPDPGLGGLSGAEGFEVGVDGDVGNFRGSAREHDGFPSRERLADGVEGFPAHDEGSAHGFVLEPAEILGEMPGDSPTGTDDPVFGHGGDGVVDRGRGSFGQEGHEGG